MVCGDLDIVASYRWLQPVRTSSLNIGVPLFGLGLQFVVGDEFHV